MTPSEIKSLVKNLSIEENAQLIETHISWVILTHEFAFKFKKPIRYSFLNYAKPMKRKYYCQQEIELNSRYSNIYLDVVPVYREGASVTLTKGEEVIDFGVKMLRMNPVFQMDKMLENDQVNISHLTKLATKIAGFHQNAEVIRKPISSKKFIQNFDDIGMIKPFLYNELGLHADQQINEAMLESNHFINSNVPLLENRMKYGFIRDLHGDLHSKNIFLYKDPILFDCIEFNDDFRQVDVLSELAFLCMDLESYGREELSTAFFTKYMEVFPVISNPEQEYLFAYYKCYRANVRAKVNALRAKQAKNSTEKAHFLDETNKYLGLMTWYKNQFSRSNNVEIYESNYDNNHHFAL